MNIQVRRTGAADYGRWTKVLICGDPGAGKTLISSTWPNPLYASAEGGLMSIADRQIPYVEIRKLDQLLRLRHILDQDPQVRQEIFGYPVDTLVVDTIDEVQRILIRERLEETRKDTLQLQDWGYVGETMQAIVRGLRNLQMHVVFTCHLKEVTDSETGRVSYKPQMQGQFADQIAATVDLALLLKAQTVTKVIGDRPEKVTTRFLQTYKDTAHEWIKDRSGKLPNEFSINFNDDYQRISELIFGSIDELPVSKEKELTVEEPPKLEEIPPGPQKAQSAKSTTVASKPPAISTSSNPSPPAPAGAMPKAAEPTPQEQAEANGIKIRNPKPLPIGVTPVNKGLGVDIYCERCGNEVESEDRADLSRIRFRKILCVSCFDANKR